MVSAEGGPGLTIHATLVARAGKGVLLRGRSGAGKSDLALRLLGTSGRLAWRLVSDDRVALSVEAGRLIGRAPAAIAGKLEVRGLGIIEVDTAVSAEIALAINLVPRKQVPRMPEDHIAETISGVAVPLLRLHAFDASAPAKVAVMLDWAIANKFNKE